MMMPKNSSETCDEIPHRIKRIREKRDEMDKRREELNALKKKYIEGHLQLGRDSRAIQEELSVLEEVISECNKMKSDGNICYEFPEDLRTIRNGGNTPNKKTTKNQHRAASTTLIQQKKQIRTVLHMMLDALNEQKEVRVSDLAKEFEMNADEILRWAKVMEAKGMLKVGYTIRGDAILKKPI